MKLLSLSVQSTQFCYLLFYCICADNETFIHSFIHSFIHYSAPPCRGQSNESHRVITAVRLLNSVVIRRPAGWYQSTVCSSSLHLLVQWPGCTRLNTVNTRKLAWLHHEETRELPGKRDNARNNARFTKARKATYGLDGQHQDVDRTLRGRVNQNDRGQG